MSKLTRGLVIASATASMFLAGCATQGTTDNGSGTTAPVAATVTAPSKAVNSCKGMSKCKGMSSCKGAVKHHKRAAKKHNG